MDLFEPVHERGRVFVDQKGIEQEGVKGGRGRKLGELAE